MSGEIIPVQSFGTVHFFTLILPILANIHSIKDLFKLFTIHFGSLKSAFYVTVHTLLIRNEFTNKALFKDVENQNQIKTRSGGKAAQTKLSYLVSTWAHYSVLRWSALGMRSAREKHLLVAAAGECWSRWLSYCYCRMGARARQCLERCADSECFVDFSVKADTT